MSVQYFLAFGSGDPSGKSGLAPTFTVFQTPGGGSTTPPSINEVGSSGLYGFTYTPLGPIAFVVDGATTGLTSNDRYIVGSLDVGDSSANADIGNISDPIGDSATDPTSLFGFVRRIQNWLEGQSTYTKSSGAWVVKDVTGATTISSRTIVDNGTTVDKT